MKSGGGKLLEEAPDELAPLQPEVEHEPEHQSLEEEPRYDSKGAKGHGTRHRILSLHRAFGNAAIAKAAAAGGAAHILGHKDAKPKPAADSRQEAKPKQEAKTKSGHNPLPTKAYAASPEAPTHAPAVPHAPVPHPAKPEAGQKPAAVAHHAAKGIKPSAEAKHGSAVPALKDGEKEEKDTAQKSRAESEKAHVEKPASKAPAQKAAAAETAMTVAGGGAEAMGGGSAGSAARASGGGAGGSGAAPAMSESGGAESAESPEAAATEDRLDQAEASEEAEVPSSESEEENAVGEAAEAQATLSPEATEAGAQTESDESDEAGEDSSSGESQLSSGQRDAAMKSIVQGSHAGGDTEVGGGGGGGSAIPGPPAAKIPDVSKSNPASGMGAIADLPPAQLAAALPGVSAAAANEVSKEKAHLASHPPQMERPSGAPATLDAAASERELKKLDAAAKVKRLPTGPPAPAPEPEPAPPPPPPVTAAAVEPEDASDFKAAVSALPEEDEALNEEVGPVREVPLEGDSSPAEVEKQRAEVDQTTEKEYEKHTGEVGEPMGETEIFPKVPPETLRGHGGRGRRAAPAPPKVKGIEGSLSEEDEGASMVAQEQSGDQIRAAAEQAETEMTDKRREHDESVAEERAKSREEIVELVADNRAEQTTARREALREVHGMRGDWTREQTAVVTKANKDARAAVDKAHNDIKGAQKTAKQSANAAIREANAKKERARKQAEKEAAEAKRKAAEEDDDDGVLDWLASKAKSAWNAVKSVVHKAFDLARRAVRAAINFAKKLINEAIEFARKLIVRFIKWAGDLLILIGDVVLAAFPKLRDRFRKAIRSRVARAEKFVNSCAEKLKKGVQRALDALGNALDAVLGLLEKAYMAALNAVANVVNGAINAARAVINAIKAFAVLVRDVGAGPIQWIKNLGAGIVDGIRNHLWKALKEAVSKWFNEKLEEVLGLGTALWNLLAKGGLKIADIGHMVWEAIKEAIPRVLVEILVEKLVSMLVPAAGAIMAIVEGLQAAWGTVKRILAAFERFMTFLKAVRGGNAGPPFADVVAAAAIAVIDFVANWLLKKLRGPASKIANKLRAIGQKILGGVKKVGSRIAGAARKVGAKIKAKYTKIKERLTGKKGAKKPHQEKTKKQKRSDEKKLSDAITALRPKIQAMIERNGSGLYLRGRLLAWRLSYRLRKLKLVREGERSRVVIGNSPDQDMIKNIVEANALDLHRMIREVADDLMTDPSVSEQIEALADRRAAGRGGKDQPPLLLPANVPAQAGDILQTIRQGGRQHMLLPAQGQLIPLSQMHARGQMPGQIRLEDLGRYPQIVSSVESLGDRAQAAAILRAVQTGRPLTGLNLPAGSLVAAARLTRLASTEAARDPADLVRRAMLLDLLGRGQIDHGQFVESMNAMSPVGATRAAFTAQKEFVPSTPERYKTQLTVKKAEDLKKNVAKFKSTEVENMTIWLYAQMMASDPLFVDMAGLKVFIKTHLQDYLRHLGRSTYGL